jgi:hypothetical protein
MTPCTIIFLLVCLAASVIAAPFHHPSQESLLELGEDIDVFGELPAASLGDDEDFEIFSSETRELLKLHKLLCEIESITGNEYEVGTALAQYLVQLKAQSVGWTIETQKVEDRRLNILAYTRGDRNAKTLITSHMDTV